MSEDERIDLIAMAWLGRGDGTIEDWRSCAPKLRASTTGERRIYLLGLPLLADYLEEGLAAFDRSCESYEAGINMRRHSAAWRI